APQQCHEVAINLDCIELALCRLQQQARESAAPGADLHQVLIGARADFSHDVSQHRRVVEEVLAKALAAHRKPTHAAASSMASSMAEIRLRGSARPVPARSSAVPWSTEVRRIGSPKVMLTAVSKPACLITGSPWS